MCGRFTLTRSAAEVAQHFELPEEARARAPELQARWNVAPGQPIAVVCAGPAGPADRRLELRRWGLVPSHARDPGVGARLVNARAETAASRPAFREAIRRRRCLVPADGFYEWRGPRGGRAPHHVARADGGLLALAGLHERWRPAGTPEAEPLETVVVLTTDARGPVRRLHDRMPVLVAPSAFAAWLDPAQEDPVRALQAALVGAGAEPAEALRVRPVSRRVNDAGHEGPDCLAPPEEPELPLD